MKSLNSFCLIIHRKKSVIGLGITLLFILLLSPPAITQGKSEADRYNMTRTYSLDISTRYNNTTTHIIGTQVVTFTSQDTTTILGFISWNLTWDEGLTWSYTNITQIYGTNRTYQISGVPQLTAWWSEPSVALGYYVYIDGDAPATDQLLRSTPFQVADLVSYTTDNQCFICWLLSYETLSGQQESFYYERMTGVLVAAFSKLTNQDSTSHEIFVELQSASSSLPQADLLANFWFSYGTLAISIVLATISTLGAHLLLKRASQHSADQRLRLESSKRLKK